MDIKIGKFSNITQEAFRAKSGDRFIAWYSSIMQKGNNNGIGGVDAMMKKDVKGIVDAYSRLIKKRGYSEFPKGKYEIEIRDNFNPFTATQTIFIEVEVT